MIETVLSSERGVVLKKHWRSVWVVADQAPGAERPCDSRRFFSLLSVVVPGPRGRQDSSYAVVFLP